MLFSWKEFKKGKRKKVDVKVFSKNIPENILDIYDELKSGSYRHGNYHDFYLADPKLRHIHKATVKDRIVHHAIFRILYPVFDPTFIFDSYSCRIGKGTHRAIHRFRQLAKKVSHNNTTTCWILKCDIRKFFDSMDHRILLSLIQKKIKDKETIDLLQEIITSFSVTDNKGIPLGNLTSQLFCNIYMNEFDQFVKHTLKETYYIRYADDFVVLSEDRKHLENLILNISNFLEDNLKLTLHPNKIIIKTLASGVDFLGWVNFYNHRVLRTTTKKRMLRKLKHNTNQQSIQSYLGMMSHGETYKIRKRMI